MRERAIPGTMCAVLLTGHGGLEKLEYREDVPVPVPAAGEVLIEVSACGMNNTDIWVREGAYGTDRDPKAVASWRRASAESTLTFPRIQGADSVGRIVAVGPNVLPARLHERVMVDFSLYNTEGDSLADIDYIGHGRDGGFAEYLTVPSENAYNARTTLSDIELATFCCAYLTGEQMLDRARLVAGERVLITGASGGVGSGLIQLSRARGAIPYAVVAKGKEQKASDLGAEGVITRGDDLVERVQLLTGGKPIDVVADVVGGPAFTELLILLRPEGRYTSAGAIGGPIVQLDLRTLYLKQLELHGNSQGSRAAFRRLLGYIESGAVRPLVGGVYKLSEIRHAQMVFMRKEFFGKLVIVPDKKFQHK